MNKELWNPRAYVEFAFRSCCNQGMTVEEIELAFITLIQEGAEFQRKINDSIERLAA